MRNSSCCRVDTVEANSRISSAYKIILKQNYLKFQPKLQRLYFIKNTIEYQCRQDEVRSFTASDRSRAVPSRIKPFFFYVRAIRFAFFNSGRDQSERFDFAPTKTCDETNCHAHLFTVLCGNGEF